MCKLDKPEICFYNSINGLPETFNIFKKIFVDMDNSLRKHQTQSIYHSNVV